MYERFLERTFSRLVNEVRMMLEAYVFRNNCTRDIEVFRKENRKGREEYIDDLR